MQNKANFPPKVGLKPDIAHLGDALFSMLAFGCHSITSAAMPTDLTQGFEYNVSVRTNDVHSAIAKTAGALYDLVEEALQAHEDHEAEECDFELFARDVLGVLSRHADQMSNGGALSDGLHEVDPDDELGED